MGRCSWPSNDFVLPDTGNRVLLCMDNIDGLAQGGRDLMMPLLIGTLAHEVMHQADGVQGHGATGGDTNPANPRTAAATIGVAAEHLAIRPDLSVVVRSHASTIVGDTSNFRVEVTVSNENEWSGPAGTRPLSNRDQNPLTSLEWRIDGDLVATTQVDPLGGGADRQYTFDFTLPNYSVGDDGRFDLTVEADSDDLLLEVDERNNIATRTLSTTTDLAITRLEVAKPYTDHYEELPEGNDKGVPAGWYRWRTLTYLLEVTNVSAGWSPPCDIVALYDDMWTDTSVKSQQERMTPILVPGQSIVYEFEIDIPVNRDGIPIWATNAYFFADGNDTSIHDVDRSNNVRRVVIDRAYFKPDYLLSIDSVTFDTDADVAGVIGNVRNIGPEPAERTVELRVTRNGEIIHTERVEVLQAGQEAPLELELGFVHIIGIPDEFLVIADARNAIEELDERNNSAALVYSIAADSLDLRQFYDRVAMDEALIAHELSPGLLALIGKEATREADRLGLLNASDMTRRYFQASRPSGPFLPEMYFDRDRNALLEVYDASRSPTAIRFDQWVR